MWDIVAKNRPFMRTIRPELVFYLQDKVKNAPRHFDLSYYRPIYEIFINYREFVKQEREKEPEIKHKDLDDIFRESPLGRIYIKENFHGLKVVFDKDNRNRIDMNYTAEKSNDHAMLNVDVDFNVMTAQEMQSVINQYLLSKGRHPPAQNSLEVQWLGQGMSTKIIGYQNRAYRWIKNAGYTHYEEEKNYELLGDKLDISPKMLDSGYVTDGSGQVHKVFEVEQVIGKSLDKWTEPLTPTQMQYFKDLLDVLIEKGITFEDFKPHNFAIGYIIRDGQHLPERAYLSILNRLNRTF